MSAEHDALHRAVERLETELAAVAPELRGWLSPPAADIARRALEGTIRVLLPASLDAWLSLHDGQDDRQYPCLERWMLLPARRIALSHAALSSARLDPLAGPLSRFEPPLVPFASDEAGTYLCVGPEGSVIELADDARSRRVVAPSLAAWMDDCASAIRDGRWALDPELGVLSATPGE